MDPRSQLSLTAGLTMFKKAFMAVVRSPVSFFDTTPLGMPWRFIVISAPCIDGAVGRIMSRLSKDQDTIDTELAQIAIQVGLIWNIKNRD